MVQKTGGDFKQLFYQAEIKLFDEWFNYTSSYFRDCNWRNIVLSEHKINFAACGNACDIDTVLFSALSDYVLYASAIYRSIKDKKPDIFDI